MFWAFSVMIGVSIVWVGRLVVAVRVALVDQARRRHVLLEEVGTGAHGAASHVEAAVSLFRDDEELTLKLRGEPGEDRSDRLLQLDLDRLGVGSGQ